VDEELEALEEELADGVEELDVVALAACLALPAPEDECELAARDAVVLDRWVDEEDDPDPPVDVVALRLAAALSAGSWPDASCT
jgi:hypothetical protein